MASLTSLRVVGLTTAGLLMQLDTVWGETPAALATSLMLTIVLPFMFMYSSNSGARTYWFVPIIVPDLTDSNIGVYYIDTY